MMLILRKRRTVMMTIMSHQPARAGSPARLGQLTHPLTSSWDLWSPGLTRILQDFAFFIMSGLFEGNRKGNLTKIRHGLLRDLSFVFLFVLLSDVSRKIWAPVHSSTWLESFVIQVSTSCPPFNPPPNHPSCSQPTCSPVALFTMHSFWAFCLPTTFFPTQFKTHSHSNWSGSA